MGVIHTPTLMGLDLETYSSAPLPKCGVQTQTTEILSEFPTKAAKEAAPPQTAKEAEEIPLF